MSYSYPPVWQTWPNNLKFRPALIRWKPVKGGRWQVRKDPNARVGGNRQWKAWTLGVAKRWNRRFGTFEEAIEHARFVTNCYNAYDRATADKAIGDHIRSQLVIRRLAAQHRAGILTEDKIREIVRIR